MPYTKTVAAALMALTAAGTTLSTPTEADAHPALLVGLAAGALGIAVGAAIAHEARPVVVERTANADATNCVVEQRVNRWGRVHNVEVCR